VEGADLDAVHEELSEYIRCRLLPDDARSTDDSAVTDD
jgi:hypothetical protein